MVRKNINKAVLDYITLYTIIRSKHKGGALPKIVYIKWGYAVRKQAVTNSETAFLDE